MDGHLWLRLLLRHLWIVGLCCDDDIIAHKFYGLLLRIVKNGGVLNGVNELVTLGSVYNLKLHLVEEVRRVQKFADDINGLCTHVGQESNGGEAQDCAEAWRTNQVADGIANRQAVITARVVAEIPKEWGEVFCQDKT